VWAETGILQAFPAGGLKVRWRAPVGPGWSTPVVAKGRAYLTDSELNKPRARERVHCFDEATGQPLWTHSYEVAYPDWAFPVRGPTATPIVQDGKPYTLGNKGDLYSLNTGKGDVLWKRNLEKDHDVQEFAFNASPLIEGDQLVVCVGSYPGTQPSSVLALDKNSGREVWKAPTGGLTNSSPIVVTAGGKRQLIVWAQDGVLSLDPATGKTYWQQKMTTAAASAVTTPVFDKNRLLLSGLMLKLDADKPAASVLWPDSKAASARTLSVTSTGLIQGDYVFSAKSSGELVCLEAGTGKPVWTTDKVTKLGSGASIHLTPNGDGFFLHTDQGELIRAQLSGKGYKEDGRTLSYYYLPQLLRAAPWLGRAIDKGGAREAAHCAHCPPAHLPGLKEAFAARLPDDGAMFAPAVVRYDARGLDVPFHHLSAAAGVTGRRPAWAGGGRTVPGGCRGGLGLWEAAGFAFHVATYRRGGAGCCVLRARTGPAA
jgi:outer membrane protein assembly factor BamB